MKQDHYLSVAEILQELSEGRSILHENTGHKVWLNNKSGKLESDKLAWVGSLPGFIFNNDIKFVREAK